MLFTSFAANYSVKDIIRHVFAAGTSKDSLRLTKAISKRYGGEVLLYQNGRSALAATIMAKVPKGSGVIINGMTCYAVVQAVKGAGCEVVYADIGEDLNFTTESLQESTKKHKGVRAVIIQNHLGVPVDQSVIKMARKLNLTIIEDLAHSAGVKYADGREAGTVGEAAILSFGKGKSIDAVTGGAAIIRGDSLVELTAPSRVARYSERVQDRFYPFWGWLVRGQYPVGVGKVLAKIMFSCGLARKSGEGRVNLDNRLTHWQAKLAIRQFERLDEIAVERRRVAERIGKQLGLKEFEEGAAPLRVAVRRSNREEILKQLRKAGYYFDDIWYDAPVAPRRYYSRVDFPEKECPEAVEAANTLMNIPTHYSAKKLEGVIKILRKVNNE